MPINLEPLRHRIVQERQTLKASLCELRRLLLPIFMKAISLQLATRWPRQRFTITLMSSVQSTEQDTVQIAWIGRTPDPNDVPPILHHVWHTMGREFPHLVLGSSVTNERIPGRRTPQRRNTVTFSVAQPL